MDIRNKLKAENKEIYDKIKKRILKEDPDGASALKALKERDKISKEYLTQIEPLEVKLKSVTNKFRSEFNEEKAKLAQKFANLDNNLDNKFDKENEHVLKKVSELLDKISKYRTKMDEEINEIKKSSHKKSDDKIGKIQKHYEEKIAKIDTEIKNIKSEFSNARKIEQDKLDLHKAKMGDKLVEEFGPDNEDMKIIFSLQEKIKGLSKEMNSKIQKINTEHGLERIDIYFQEMGSKLKHEFTKHGKIGPISPIDTIDYIYGRYQDTIDVQKKQTVPSQNIPELEKVTFDEYKAKVMELKLQKALEGLNIPANRKSHQVETDDWDLKNDKGKDAVHGIPNSTPGSSIDSSPRADSVSSIPPPRHKSAPPEAPVADQSSSSPPPVDRNITHSRQLSKAPNLTDSAKPVSPQNQNIPSVPPPPPLASQSSANSNNTKQTSQREASISVTSVSMFKQEIVSPQKLAAEANENAKNAIEAAFNAGNHANQANDMAQELRSKKTLIEAKPALDAATAAKVAADKSKKASDNATLAAQKVQQLSLEKSPNLAEIKKAVDETKEAKKMATSEEKQADTHKGTVLAELGKFNINIVDALADMAKKWEGRTKIDLPQNNAEGVDEDEWKTPRGPSSS